MKFSVLIVCYIINIIICFGIPIGYVIYLIAVKRRGLKSFFIGTLVFLISQVFLRLPIIQYILPKMDWYNDMIIFYPIVYYIFLGVTAGLFEEIGRFLGFKLALKERRSWFDGLSFGIGHGGIEAIIILGISNIQNLTILISLNKGSYDAGKFGISYGEIIEIFQSATGMSVLLGGIERIFAIILHVALTLLVLYGINQNKKVYLFLAILIHASFDAIFGLLFKVGFNIYIIEFLNGIFSVALLMFFIKIRNKFV